MATHTDEIDERLADWIRRQHVFFVATAPTGPGGHVNVSPKGYDSLRVLGPRRVAYLDLTGSGAETIGHLRDNGRITVMFCAFEGRPQIARLHGTGRALLEGDGEYAELEPRFPRHPGARAIIDIDVERVSTSCGYAVPFMDYVGERPTLDQWANRKGPDGLAAYHANKNRYSIDGLPALDGSPELVERDAERSS